MSSSKATTPLLRPAIGKKHRDISLSAIPSSSLFRPSNFIKKFFAHVVEGYYVIESTIKSPATQVFFTHKDDTGEQYCIKRWLPCSNGLYETENQNRRTQYTKDGWNFNRLFASPVYIAIAPIEVSERGVHLGKKVAQYGSFATNIEYALLMKRLD